MTPIKFYSKFDIFFGNNQVTCENRSNFHQWRKWKQHWVIKWFLKKKKNARAHSLFRLSLSHHFKTHNSHHLHCTITTILHLQTRLLVPAAYIYCGPKPQKKKAAAIAAIGAQREKSANPLLSSRTSDCIGTLFRTTSERARAREISTYRL